MLLLSFLFTLAACSKGKPDDTTYDNGIDYKEKENALAEAQYIKFLALAVAAEYPDGTVVPLFAVENSKYQPVLKVYGSFVQKGRLRTIPDKTYYELRLHGCLKYGFRYLEVTPEKLEEMLQWQGQKGLQLLYPLIADNKNVWEEDPNVWYKVSTSGKYKMMPVDENGKIMTYSEDMVLLDNYLRDESNNVVYYVQAVDEEGNPTGNYKVRVLFYNYFQHKHGRKPVYPDDMSKESLAETFAP